MPQNAFSIEPFEAKRVRVESARSFDEVLLNLRNLVGTALPQTGTRRRDSLAHSFLSLLHIKPNLCILFHMTPLILIRWGHVRPSAGCCPA